MSQEKVLAALIAAATAVGSQVAPAAPTGKAEVKIEAAICNTYCDGRDATLSPADRSPVSTTLFGRTFKLHADDADAMLWATVENGNPGDEVWMDRSFDGGRSWTGDGRIGATKIASGARTARTTMFNNDDWNNRGVGVLRACGKAGDRDDIACTSWARSTWNSGTRSTAAATALMERYDRSTGLFDGNGWWTSANALTAIIDNSRVSGMHSYDYAIATTYDKQVNAAQGQFRNEFIDDTGWWGLAWVAAYDRTGNSRYLNTAKADADHMHAYWDSTCGGGVYWKTDRANKNAISNSLYIQLNAALAQRISGDTTYKGRARTGWSWFQASGMINGENLVNDGLNGSCRNNGDVTWTYNQGVLINALTQLNKATGDANALTVARRIGNAATASGYLNPGGILREPNEPDECTGDGVSFKGAFVRGLGALNAAAGRPYDAYLRTQADSAYANNRTSWDAYGSHWAGPYRTTNHSCQHSVLDLLNAAP
jgi:hypothetical protein